MSTTEVVIFGIFFAATAGASFAFMWRSIGSIQKEMNDVRSKKSIHPEMRDVKSGEQLLVFNSQLDDDDDDDVMIVRK
jgi:hypothetical protein|tara:strand:+ start:803 stop:1036 length:234 start_codon:yes stop_codon:yes gene_type:complete